MAKEHSILVINFLDSNNQLVQELFQSKLSRKGTLAPSDRQSKLRKSISINENLAELKIISTKEEISSNSSSGKTITSSISSSKRFLKINKKIYN